MGTMFGKETLSHLKEKMSLRHQAKSTGPTVTKKSRHVRVRLTRLLEYHAICKTQKTQEGEVDETTRRLLACLRQMQGADQSYSSKKGGRQFQSVHFIGARFGLT